jgi:hypothetical protein
MNFRHVQLSALYSQYVTLPRLIAPKTNRVEYKARIQSRSLSRSFFNLKLFYFFYPFFGYLKAFKSMHASLLSV